jgi:hypothetical protein
LDFLNFFLFLSIFFIKWVCSKYSMPHHLFVPVAQLTVVVARVVAEARVFAFVQIEKNFFIFFIKFF